MTQWTIESTFSLSDGSFFPQLNVPWRIQVRRRRPVFAEPTATCLRLGKLVNAPSMRLVIAEL
eukprot:5084212-Prymnesium_polylepis.2